MKLDSLGLNHFVFGSATTHAVAPLSSALSSVHSRAQPPQSSSLMPRFFLYHSPRAFPSFFALMNTPPIPVTLAICFLSLLSKFWSGSRNTELPFQIVPIAETSLIREYFKRHSARIGTASRHRGALRRFRPRLFSQNCCRNQRDHQSHRERLDERVQHIVKRIRVLYFHLLNL